LYGKCPRLGFSSASFSEVREEIRQFVSLVASSLKTPEPIYEFGSLQVSGQEAFADLRPFFPGREYVGCDMREGPGVDRVLNLHGLDLPDDSVGTALVIETLEHVEFPRRALMEIHRVLGPGGVVVATSLMNFPIHDHPHDYWRFTPQGFESLLAPFSTSFVGSAGSDDFPHTVIGIGVKSKQESLDDFISKYERWRWEWSDRSWPKSLRLSGSPVATKAEIWLRGPL
jgi:SAM-dependent methyltransferase